jgi:hypothetical protein
MLRSVRGGLLRSILSGLLRSILSRLLRSILRFRWGILLRNGKRCGGE